MIYFILGQIGLFLIMTCGIGILHCKGKSDSRPPWYYVIAIWLLSVGAAFMLSDPYVYGPDDIPAKAYLFRFGMGLVFLTGNVAYARQGKDRPAGRSMFRLNMAVGVLASVVVLSAIAYAVRNDDEEGDGGLRTLYMGLSRKFSRIETALADSSVLRSQQVMGNRALLYEVLAYQRQQQKVIDRILNILTEPPAKRPVKRVYVPTYKIPARPLPGLPVSPLSTDKVNAAAILPRQEPEEPAHIAHHKHD